MDHLTIIFFYVFHLQRKKTDSVRHPISTKTHLEHMHENFQNPEL